MRSTFSCALVVPLLLGCQPAPPPAPSPGVVEKLAGGMKFTEGPVWLPSEGILVFSDIPNSRLMQWSDAGGISVFRESQNPNGNMLDLEGRLLTCQHGARNIVRTEADGSLTVLADRFEGKRLNSPNDMAVQSDGSIWFTDPPWGLGRQREGKELDGHWVFHLDPDTSAIRVVLRGLVMPNGIALSPDEKVLYVADTGGHPSHPDPVFRNRPPTVSAYAVGDDHELSTEPLWRIETRCDGMCVDVQGNIYTTGSSVDIWRPDGTQLGRIPVPEQPANVSFGGPDRETLFITARTSLYAVPVGIAGSKPPGAQW